MKPSRLTCFCEHWQKRGAGRSGKAFLEKMQFSRQIHRGDFSSQSKGGVSARPRRRQACWEQVLGRSSVGKRMKNRQQVRYWRAKHVESFTLYQAWLLALQKGHSGSIWKIAEIKGKTEGRETQQHQQGQPLLHCPDHIGISWGACKYTQFSVPKPSLPTIFRIFWNLTKWL